VLGLRPSVLGLKELASGLKTQFPSLVAKTQDLRPKTQNPPPMTRRRWIADEAWGNHAALTGEHADHLVRVLRARVGQEFDISLGAFVRRGQITLIADHRVDFELGEVVPASPPVKLTLLLAVFKFDRMEWAIEKCTELGVSRIVPVIARRTDAHLAAAAGKRAERWRRLVRQAAEQSRRAAPSEVSNPLKLQEVVGTADGLRIVLAETEEKTPLRDALDAQLHESDAGGGARATSVILAIGPEGGWTDDELQLFAQAGWISASLGGTILRAETAAIAATAITISVLA
jgi:16S rRNA (uracil1498-N3)-methyltransferase